MPHIKRKVRKVERINEINELFTVNGKPINRVISEYVDRNDVKGLADLFRAFLIDLTQITDKTISQQEVGMPPEGTGKPPIF